MSGVHRFLSRRDKHADKQLDASNAGEGGHGQKVMSPPPSPLLPTVAATATASATAAMAALAAAGATPSETSYSASSSTSLSGVATPFSYASFSSYHHYSSSSVSSLSNAFSNPKAKRSPSLCPTRCVVQTTTANSWALDGLLQPASTAGDLHGLFTHESDGRKKSSEKEQEKKIKALANRLSQIGITNLKDPQLEYALKADFSKGDPDKAYKLLMLFQDSLDGLIKEPDPTVKLLGSVNRKGVTCYLDAVLFAMFARLGSFEAILYPNFPDEPRKRLSLLIRLWVNMLRTGKLITEDITKHLQEALAECGWKEAARLNQQDASEAFSFITGKLELPLLTLKMDIFHYGKDDPEGDHRFVNERLLEVAIPETPSDGKVITLEDCLETYFNNKVQVKREREAERRATLTSISAGRPFLGEKGGFAHIETSDLGSRPSTPGSHLSHSPAPMTPMAEGRDRASSIIKEVPIPEEAEGSQPPKYREGTRRRSSTRREVEMPAWQFFSLIPWYTDHSPTNDAQVAAHFSTTRPVVGLCLKRYKMDSRGRAQRLETFVDIPVEIGLPHFIQDDKMEDDGPLFGNFKLSLQSVVCHRGTSVNSGHYIALVRSKVSPANATAGDAQMDDELATWLKLDDLANPRVSTVDIKKALREEMPYLLFYQVRPIDETPPDTIFGDAPPAYTDSSVSIPKLNRDASAHDRANDSAVDISEGTSSEISRPDAQTFPSGGTADSTTSTSLSEVPSSLKLDPSSSTASLREPDKPAIPDEASGLSRKPSKRGRGGSKSRPTSRPTSQSGEGRLSLTLSRITGRSRDKLAANDEVGFDTLEQPSVRIEEVESRRQLPPPPPLPEGGKGKIKKEKRKEREKSKTRGARLERGGGPDRECVVM